VKKEKLSFIRSAILVALTGLFMYSSSVQEIHYLFSRHDTEVKEHCDNHLHQQTHHAECIFCKINLSPFSKSCNQFELTADIVFFSTPSFGFNEPCLNNPLNSNYLRGPPQIS
jgi:hypothetical protein